MIEIIQNLKKRPVGSLQYHLRKCSKTLDYWREKYHVAKVGKTKEAVEIKE